MAQNPKNESRNHKTQNNLYTKTTAILTFYILKNVRWFRTCFQLNITYQNEFASYSVQLKAISYEIHQNCNNINSKMNEKKKSKTANEKLDWCQQCCAAIFCLCFSVWFKKKQVYQLLSCLHTQTVNTTLFCDWFYRTQL